MIRIGVLPAGEDEYWPSIKMGKAVFHLEIRNKKFKSRPLAERKRKDEPPKNGGSFKLTYDSNVVRLRAFFPGNDVELYFGAFLEVSSIRVIRVDEYVFGAIIRGNKPETFRSVEKLYGTFGHLLVSLSLKRHFVV